MDKTTLFQLQFADLRDFLGSINGEVEQYNALAKAAGDTPFQRRLCVRTTFSCIEAHLSHLKASALALTTDQDGLFSEDEKLALQDQEKRVSKSGQITLIPARLTMKENIKLAFSAFSRVAETRHVVDLGNQGAVHFFEAVKVRDRVVHPKSARDWKVSDAEMELVRLAWIWFGRHLVAVSKRPLAAKN